MIVSSSPGSIGRFDTSVIRDMEGAAIDEDGEGVLGVEEGGRCRTEMLGLHE